MFLLFEMRVSLYVAQNALTPGARVIHRSLGFRRAGSVHWCTPFLPSVHLFISLVQGLEPRAVRKHAWQAFSH